MKRNSHGGVRTGAGRKRKFGEITIRKQLPQSSEQEFDTAIDRLLTERNRKPGDDELKPPRIRHAVELPLYSNKIEAGSPSFFGGEVEEYIDVNDYLGTQERADYYLRVTGHSMIDAGIVPDDLLVVERSTHAKDGDIVIALVDGGLTVKRLEKIDGNPILRSENSAQLNFSETTYSELSIVGIVRGVARRV